MRLLELTIIFSVMLSSIVFAIPEKPHQFYGSVKINGAPAIDSSIISVRIDGIEVASTLTLNGKYGYSPVFFIEDPNNNRAGKVIEFFVDGSNSGQTGVFVNGESTEMDLDASITTTTTGGGSPGGSSGGSSGGLGVTTTTTISQQKKTTGSISPESPGSFIFDDDDLKIDEIIIDVLDEVVDVEVSVKRTTEISAGIAIATDDGLVYEYMEIGANIQNDDISGVKIRFRVEKAWFKDNNIDPESAVLRRLVGSSWTVLDTTMISQDNRYYYYEADSPGFSMFAVTGRIVVTCNERWVCSDWSLCKDGLQARLCYDANSCNTEDEKPLESQPCSSEAIAFSKSTAGMITAALANPIVPISLVSFASLGILGAWRLLIRKKRIKKVKKTKRRK